MRTGLGLYRKYRYSIAFTNLVRYSIRKKIIGSDNANQILSKLDKYSLLLILKKNGATIGKNTDIEPGQTFHNCKDFKNLSIGNNTHIGKNCFFDLRNMIFIEDNVTISMLCTFITHIDLGNSLLKEVYPSKNSPIQIGRNSYIGACSTILMGSEIHEFSFVAANSMVNKCVESKTMVGGVPIKKLKDLKIL